MKSNSGLLLPYKQELFQTKWSLYHNSYFLLHFLIYILYWEGPTLTINALLFPPR